MSMGPAETVVFIGGIIVYAFTQPFTSSWIVMGVVMVSYVISMLILWDFSPYQQEFRPGCTGPALIKDGEWGFER